MKNFIELIQKAHQTNFTALSQRLIRGKTPVAVLAYSLAAEHLNVASNFKSQGLNVSPIISITPPPGGVNFDILSLEKALENHLSPEYIWVRSCKDYKFAHKFFPKANIIWMSTPTPPMVNYDFFMNNLPKLYEFYESLIDEDSKQTFCGYWLSNISYLLNKAVFANAPQYICAGFIPKEGDVFIDCGVCDGNTSLRFSKMGCKVYGFEMDKKNYEIAKKLADKNGFTVENLGLGSFKHDTNYVHYDGNIGASRLDAGGSETTAITTLDSYVVEKQISKLDFIKMDVEGAELDILKGAATTISRFKPILAISVYHKPDDFWKIMDFIKSLRPDYEYALRHYPSSREDVPFMFEDDMENLFHSFDMDVTLPTFAECVLFAR